MYFGPRMSPESATSIGIRIVLTHRPDRFLGLGQIRCSEIAGSAPDIPKNREPGTFRAGLVDSVTGVESTNGDGVR